MLRELRLVREDSRTIESGKLVLHVLCVILVYVHGFCRSNGPQVAIGHIWKELNDCNHDKFVISALGAWISRSVPFRWIIISNGFVANLFFCFGPLLGRILEYIFLFFIVTGVDLHFFEMNDN